MSDKTDAIVIRQADFSESSRVVTFFTRDFGKIAMLAKGGRRQKNPFDSALDLLAESSIVFLQKQSALSLLTEASLKARFRPPADDLAILYAGYYVSELLDALMEEADPHITLYDQTALTLAALVTGQRRLRVVSRFELTLLREFGQCPMFDECLACGRSTLDSEQERFVHWVLQGGVLCENCRVESFQARQLSPTTFQLLRRLADYEDDMSDVNAISKKHVVELRSVLDQLVAYAMAKKPKMSRYLTF